MSLDDIEKARATPLPRGRVPALILGRIDPSVAIGPGTAPARDGHPIPLRIYRPTSLRDVGSRVPVVAYFHGGGWVLGNVLSYDPLCTFLAADLTLRSPSLAEHAEAPILGRADVDAFADHYAPVGVDRSDPLLSPLLGRLDGLPPALVQTADLDPIRDNGIRYATALREAGNEVRLTNYVGAPHGFASFPGAVPTGRQHRAELVAELRHHLQ